MKVYVIAWEYGVEVECPAGGGFDWYFTKVDADKAYTTEQQNETLFADEGWRAYRFEVHLSDDYAGHRDKITGYIDGLLVDTIEKIKKT